MGLETSIAEMIERQDSLSDKADAAEARLNGYMAQTSPGLQPMIGIWPNQCGVDSNGDGAPDGWYLPYNEGLTSWSHVAATPETDATEVVTGSVIEEFYLNTGLGFVPNYMNHRVHVWRWSWDLSGAATIPSHLHVLSDSRAPANGQFGLWLKDEEGVLPEHLHLGRLTEDRNGWRAYHQSREPGEPRSALDRPGYYMHARLTLVTEGLPEQGSLLIAGPQVIPAWIDVARLGWAIWPGLNRSVVDGEYRYSLGHVSEHWEVR